MRAAALCAMACAAALYGLARSEVSQMVVDVPFGARKCFREDFPSDTEVRGEYAVVAAAGAEMSVHLRISRLLGGAEVLTKAELASGSFSFHTRDVAPAPAAATAGVAARDAYQLCLFHRERQDEYRERGTSRRVRLRLTWGAHEADDASLAKRSDASDAHLAIARIERELSDVLSELDAMHARERRLSYAAEMINAEVVYFSVLSCATLLITGLYQRWYIRRFFRSKGLFYL